MPAHSPVSRALMRSSARRWNPVAISTTRPAAPSTSVTPMKTTRGRGTSENPVHRSRPRPMSFGVPAARKNRARKPWMLQRTTFSVFIALPPAPRDHFSDRVDAGYHRQDRRVHAREVVHAGCFDPVVVHVADEPAVRHGLG